MNHPYSEKLLREVVESLQARVACLVRQACDETCPGVRQSILDEAAALREDKEEIRQLLA